MTSTEHMIAEFARRGLTLAVAESCTGGLIAAEIVSIPGSSSVFLGGIIAYANNVKRMSLGVSEETLNKYGAVSGECSVEMAHGARIATNADVAVSSTGIAGPNGGITDKPVGTVYIGLSCKAGDSYIRLFLNGTRNEIRDETVNIAIGLLIKTAENWQ